MLDAPSIGLVSGAAAAAAATLGVAWEARETARRRTANRQRTADRRDKFAGQLEAALRWSRASEPKHKAWIGVRPFRVAAVVDEADDCKSFYLVPEDGRPLPRFEPGQYLTFHLPASEANRPVVRCYSLSDRPREDYYRVTVKRLPQGRGSGYFHGEAPAGTLLDVEAPQGAFFLDPTDPAPIVLCGAGVGVTPLVSMLSALAYRTDSRAVYAFLGFRNSAEHLFRMRIGELARELPTARVDVTYSRPLPQDELVAGSTNGEFSNTGHVTIDRLRAVLPSSNFRYYVCGPPGMMESLVPALVAWGAPPEHIHFEAFGPATVLGLGGNADMTAPCDVEFALSEKSMHWTGSTNSLLDLAAEGGVRIDSGCRAGNCGQCRVMLAAGQVTHMKPPGVELAEGECLACIARPRGDVIVEA